MTLRRPLVLIAGDQRELPVGDTLPGNAFFTGTATLPALSALGLAGSATFTVAPRVTGDTLAVGECITVTPAVALASGLNIAWAIVSGQNQVQVGLTATLAVSLSTVAFTVCALR
jgi:hypothetical protein